jgi:DNA-binding NtrC family response regulator
VAATSAAMPEVRGADVMTVCARLEDRVRLREIFRERGLRLCEASTWREGAEGCARRQPHVVICEAKLPDADWKEVLSATASLRDPPRVIVISSQADEFLWAEVLNLGGYDLLPTPLVEAEVARVVGLAWQDWKRALERPGKRP